MIKFDLIPVNERKNYVCHACKTNKSVKYRAYINEKPFCYCNGCVLRGLAEKEFEANKEVERGF